MKKAIFTSFILLAFATISFAGDGMINAKVLKAFRSDFSNAQQVSWEIGDHYYSAKFVQDGSEYLATYDIYGQLLSASRNILSTQLPVSLRAGVKKYFGNHWITELVEISNGESKMYNATLKGADEIIHLQSIDGEEWIENQESIQ